MSCGCGRYSKVSVPSHSVWANPVMPLSGSWKYSARKAIAEEGDEEEEEEELRRYRSQTARALPAGGVGLRASLPAEVDARGQIHFLRDLQRPDEIDERSPMAAVVRQLGAEERVHAESERVLRVGDLRPEGLARVVVLDVLPAVQEPELAGPVVVEGRRDLQARRVVRGELAHPPARVVRVVLREEDLVSDVARLDAGLEEDAAADVQVVRDGGLVDVPDVVRVQLAPRGRRPSRFRRRR